MVCERGTFDNRTHIIVSLLKARKKVTMVRIEYDDAVIFQEGAYQKVISRKNIFF